MGVQHPSTTLANTWSDIVNFPKGYDADADALTLKMVTPGVAGDPLNDFEVGFIDGLARSVIMHGAVVLIDEEVMQYVTCTATNDWFLRNLQQIRINTLCWPMVRRSENMVGNMFGPPTIGL